MVELFVTGGVFLLSLITGGAEFEERVVVLPSKDNVKSEVVVNTSSQGEIVLNEPYQSVSRIAGKYERQHLSRSFVYREFGTVLAALPPRPATYTFYFKISSDELTEESIAQFERMKADIASRQSPEVLVVGHTDTLGDMERNDKLSVERATYLKQILIGYGVGESMMQVYGRGERELLVRTPDETAEPANRRVKVTIR